MHRWMIIFFLFSGTVLYGKHTDYHHYDSLSEHFNYDKLIRDADSLLMRDASQPMLWMWKARAYSSLFKYNESLHCYKMAYDLDSGNVVILTDLANAYRNAGDLNSALFAYYSAMKKVPENPYFKLKMAELLYLQEDYKSALSVYQALLIKDSLNPYVLEQTGNCYKQLGVSDSAAHFYQKVIELDSSDISAISKLANIYSVTRQYKKGTDLTENYRKRDTLNEGINRQNAYLFYLDGQYQTAVKRFSGCFLSGDSGKFVNKYLGLSYYRLETYDLAEKYLSVVFNQDTGDAETCYYLGVACIRSGLSDKGFQYLNRLPGIMDFEIRLLFNSETEMAAEFNQKGDNRRALDLLLKAFALKPNDLFISFRIAYQYDYLLKEYEHALPFYRQFVATPAADKNKEFFEIAKERIPEIELLLKHDQ
jgi:tetratricopeptide (TPR) repeat protein